MTELDVPVLVVGAGPIGLLAGHMFEQLGIKALVAERHAGRLDAPKAHALNSRSLEICHAAGLPMDTIHAKATRSNEGALVRFMTSVIGEELGSIPYERQDEAVRALTPWPLINIAQPDFEVIVEDALEGASHVELRRQLEWLGYEESGDVVISRLRDHSGGEDILVRSRYLIAADGAGSLIRNAAGIALEGIADIAHNVMIHFEGDLRGLVGDRPAVLYFIFGEAIGSVFIAYDVGKTWVLMHPYDPATTVLADFTDEVCIRLISTAIGSRARGPGQCARRSRAHTARRTCFWLAMRRIVSRRRVASVLIPGSATFRISLGKSRPSNGIAPGQGFSIAMAMSGSMSRGATWGKALETR